jgi:hypothetical protein
MRFRARFHPTTRETDRWDTSSSSSPRPMTSERSRPGPQRVIGLDEGVSMMAARAFTTCALMKGGTVRWWGANDAGQLGELREIMSSRPVDIVFSNGR